MNSNDTIAQMPFIQKAVTLLRWYNVTPKRYYVNVLIQDIDEAIERIKFLKGLYLDCFAQPYRDYKNTEPTEQQKSLARWVNHKAIFKSVPFDEYKKGCLNGQRK